MNEIETINHIKEVITLMGKEGCIKIYESLKRDSPKIYDYQCKCFGHDLIGFINSL